MLSIELVFMILIFLPWIWSIITLTKVLKQNRRARIVDIGLKGVYRIEC